MKELTLKEELEILEKVSKKDEFIGNGSSRAVYGLDENTVVKVGFGSEGQVQNINEINLFAQLGRDYLAEIYAYGEFIVVAERIDAWDRYEAEDLLECYDEAESESDWKANYDWAEMGVTYQRAKEASELYDVLNEATGFTEDNEQIGVRSTGEFVAYDYGYETYETNSRQVGNISFAINSYGLMGIVEEVINNTRKKLLEKV